MVKINPSVIKKKKYILVDFFDTLMFRRVHSSQMMGMWDNALSKKLDIKKGLLSKTRKLILKNTSENECAIPYKKLCDEIYNKLKINETVCTKKEFYEFSLNIEMYCELSVQYVNVEMMNYLFKQKKNKKKIILVTDFYLPKESYKLFCKRYNLNNLFDKIYCSSSVGKTKAGNGELYSYILHDLHEEASQMIMIGDSIISDVTNAEKFGIKGIHYFPIAHKIQTNLSKILNLNYSNQARKNISNSTKKEIMLGEYAFTLAYFTKRLYKNLYQNSEPANFLSRGGYFLKKLFDAYNYFCIPKEKKIDSNYLFNSRKVNQKAKNDKQAETLLYNYLKPYIKNDKFTFIDEGWYGHGQLIFTDILGLNTKGYYLGLMDNYPHKNCKRNGMLFNIDEKRQKSDYYGIFRTNCTLYEQLLTAPHGSVQSYEYDNKEKSIKVNLVENEKETKLYEKFTKKYQDLILDESISLFVADCKLDDYYIAKLMLKKLLFASREKINILNEYNDGYFNNVVDNSKKEFGRVTDIKIKISDLLLNPENYMRYFCKVKEKCKGILYYFYIPLGVLIYLYTLLNITIKHLLKNKDNED